MQLFRLTLRLTAPLGTPLAGPTIFGQLCWLRREAEGEAALVRWLAELDALWRLSDGFPHGCLPKPLTRLLEGEAPDEVKLRKKRPYIRRELWLKHRAAWNGAALPLDAFVGDTRLEARLVHNVVDRHGRGTLETGGLFFMDEDWRFVREDTSRVDIYVESPEAPATIRSLFEQLGREGYGRDASTGRGCWEVESVEPDATLAEQPDARRRMSLSRGILTPETMHDAYWRLQPHFGRTGPQVALTGTGPFKRPVLLTEPGATFAAASAGVAGRWVTGLHPARPEIGLNGLHLSIPFTEAA